jgi:hypothetical protein
MASLIDTTKPASGNAYTEDVRQNFATAAAEISALQDSVNAPEDTGGVTIGNATIGSIVISVGQGVPGGATPGFDRIGSQYTDTNGTPGSALYLSNGDGTWSVVG